MKINNTNIATNFNSIPESSFWNTDKLEELKMHKIHAYPAKFPSLVVNKSIQFVKKKGLKVDNLADVFCGCGTTALEAKRNQINFWGCDINPVATLIARTKSEKYNSNILLKYYNLIVEDFSYKKFSPNTYYLNHERIRYWFDKNQIIELNHLLDAIRDNVPKGKYRNFFLTAFSNILKPNSKWLTKSIKPQLDPNKPSSNVKETFVKQFQQMLNANKELNFLSDTQVKIQTTNFLEQNFTEAFIDLVVTSPPYVTSYEYADLHQLSSLWLGYTANYRTLRTGTIGSLYHKQITEDEINKIPKIGQEIYKQMLCVEKRKARSIAKYFIDIQSSVAKIHQILNPDGYAVFVIGNTSYKNVHVDNAKFLTKCLLNKGFLNIEVIKRKISRKILTPFRDSKGRFSRNSKHKKVYSHEFVVIGKK